MTLVYRKQVSTLCMELRGIHSIDRWKQDASWEKLREWKIANWGNFMVANCKHDIKCCPEMRFESPKCVQMRLRLGKGPHCRRWGSLQCSPRLPSWICGRTFQWYQHRWPWTTLNPKIGVFSEFSAILGWLNSSIRAAAWTDRPTQEWWLRNCSYGCCRVSRIKRVTRLLWAGSAG